MLKSVFSFAAAVLVLLPLSAAADEYSVEVIDGAPDSGDVSPELIGVLSERGLRVQRDGSRTVCEIWFTRDWDVVEGFSPSPQRLYPFTSGQLVGVLHFPRRGHDFRDQSIRSGWYTLRFALQPIDGNHVGTSLTRDFFILIEAADDTPDKDWDSQELMTASAAAAGSTHPAMLCLQKPTSGDAPAMRHDEAREWWVLHAEGRAAGDDGGSVPLDLVIVGHAAE